MSIFAFRDQLITDYASYVKSFLQIRHPAIRSHVETQLDQGILWPEPLLQLNPLFAPGEPIEALARQGVLHQECARIFRVGKSPTTQGKPLRLHMHQSEAITMAKTGASYVLTTGTGSGKSLAYMIPIVDAILRHGSGQGIQAIVVYPMNALANSQLKELGKYLTSSYPEHHRPVTYARYTGQEKDEERNALIANPPDILLTNYVMLELILTRSREHPLISAKNLRFLVLDELHTYRGRQGADVALLVRRTRDRIAHDTLQCVGTSATLAGSGSYEERKAGVAAMASQIFGTNVRPEQVIGETLTRVTEERDLSDPTFLAHLTARVRDASSHPPRDYQGFIEDPLSIWIESTFGVTRQHGRLERSRPKSIAHEQGGAASELARLTGAPVERCIQAIQQTLLAGYECEPHPATGSPPFAFRLHQFLSKGDTVYASLEEEPYLSLQGQQFVPGNRERVLLPLVFCRECGQEYYCVWQKGGQFLPRTRTHLHSGDELPGYLYFSNDPETGWSTTEELLLSRLPDEWLEEYKGRPRVKSAQRNKLPQEMHVHPDGTRAMPASEGDALHCFFLPEPFRFCLCCGISYGGRQRSNFPKLASLSSEGRSTATTILTLSAIRALREHPLERMPAKLLSFTDNRQDASLQAGHFNDFIEVGLLRSALYQAVLKAGTEGIYHEELPHKVFDALHLPLELYASDPGVKYAALADTQRAFRNVLGYRLYRDLKRGWRITSPNLEQCGLLKISYRGLEEICRVEEIWHDCHDALKGATPETRATIGEVLLDHLRRELAIKVDYLNQEYQENLQQQSSQRLISPWAMDENESKEYATVLFPRSRPERSFGGNTYLSAHSGFGQYLRRKKTFGDYTERLRLEDTEEIIRNLLEKLRKGGLVERVVEAKKGDDVHGYQLPASAMIWQAGDGTRAFHDPVRVPREPEGGRRTNPFFVSFYRDVAKCLHHLEAREHTAQVPSDLREKREEAFRSGELPILYCSPTMELGVDIADLNLVNMRNIPPTPANYAQRSGRAGRSGQPALVFSYCSIGSSHDQYFFKRPDQMVAGAVTPPRLDLTNEDLLRAHIQAIWLAETGLSLGSSLKDVLDVNGAKPTLALLGSVRESIEDPSARRKARVRGERVLETLDLSEASWYTEDWLDGVLTQVEHQFERTCERWRDLYRAAQSQANAQDSIIRDASRPASDKKQAERLRTEAESQLKLLTLAETIEQSDFYSYRYFASEGFLPGYNFPRLPLSAYIPARRTRQQDEYLSRPRFLAISEFGPRAILYHEGSRYLINRVILALGQEQELSTAHAKQCDGCGYLHPCVESVGPDVCERCGKELPKPLRQLFRLQNVATKRQEKINSDEEERIRLGYEIRTAIRFAEQGGRPLVQMGQAMSNGLEQATLTYAHAATIWRINLGWQRRKDDDLYGFVLDKERGYWGKRDEALSESEDVSDEMSSGTMRVIPYVEDRRNCLLLELPMQTVEKRTDDLSPEQRKHLTLKKMASLEAALKNAIQVRYQLEDNELAAEPLPNLEHRRLLLFYEAAEGGAGVLRRLLSEPQALQGVAREALSLCHFDPETGEDLKRGPRSREDCEAACYDCLMTYANQRDHLHLDRKEIREILLALADTQVEVGRADLSHTEYLQQLLHSAGSELERSWLRYLESGGHRLPSHAQYLIASCRTRPDFFYEDDCAAIYIDGHFHAYPERQQRDLEQSECLEDRGIAVIRFGAQEDWVATLARYPQIFGRAI